MNTTKDFVIQPQDSSTYQIKGISVVGYHVKIIDPNSPAEVLISINKYSAPIPDSIEYDAENLAKMLRVAYQGVTVDYRKIDGRPGYVVKHLNEHGRTDHSAGYRLSDQEEIAILSDLPETSGLLDTIHIDKEG